MLVSKLQNPSQSNYVSLPDGDYVGMVAKFMRANTKFTLDIEGHTGNVVSRVQNEAQPHQLYFQVAPGAAGS